jgi:alginate O-acetyltransferase complex protein AlgJ
MIKTNEENADSRHARVGGYPEHEEIMDTRLHGYDEKKGGMQKLTSIFSALCFLLLLAVFFVSAWFSLLDQKIDWQAQNQQALLQGKTALEIEKQYNDHLWFKEFSQFIWGGLRYVALQSAARGVVVGDDGWFYTEEEFKVKDYSAGLVQKRLDVIRQVHDTLKAHNITLIVALLPAKARLYAEHLGRFSVPQIRQEAYAKVLPQISADVVIDGYSVLRHAKDTSKARHSRENGNPEDNKKLDTRLRGYDDIDTSSLPLFLKTDSHWSPEGARVMAEAVGDAVRIKGYDLPHQAFQTTQKSISLKHRGDLLRYLMGDTFGMLAEPLPEWQTEALQAGDLFADPKIAVVLAGTSYSAFEYYNFVGFLRQALQADVLNIAEARKGPVLPMQKWLKDTDLSKTDVKLVIWEFPERFLLSLSPAEEEKPAEKEKKK